MWIYCLNDFWLRLSPYPCMCTCMCTCVHMCIEPENNTECCSSVVSSILREGHSLTADRVVWLHLPGTGLYMCPTTTSNLLCGFWKIELRALGGASGIYWLSHHHSVPEIGSETLKTSMTLFEAILYACGFRSDKLYHSCVGRSPCWFCLYLHVEDCWLTTAISKMMGGSSLFSVSFPVVWQGPWDSKKHFARCRFRSTWLLFRLRSQSKAQGMEKNSWLIE